MITGYDGKNKFRFRFCPACGSELKTYLMKENEPPRLVCTKCNFINYQDPKLVVNSIIQINEKIIFLRRNGDYGSGRLVFPGGYVDRGEALESAARREAMEECGIEISVEYLQGVYSYPGRPEVVVIFAAKYLSGKLTAGDEISETVLFSPQDIPWHELAFASQEEALRDYCLSKYNILKYGTDDTALLWKPQ